MIEVTNQQELEKQIKQNGKAIVLFYASWCPFCRSFLPIFNKYAEKANSATLFIKARIDDDENPIWETYGFEAVPSIILFENGQVSRKLYCRLGSGLNEKQFIKWLTS